MKDVSGLVTGHIRYVHGQVYQQANDQSIGWVWRYVHRRVHNMVRRQVHRQIVRAIWWM